MMLRKVGTSGYLSPEKWRNWIVPALQGYKLSSTSPTVPVEVSSQSGGNEDTNLNNAKIRKFRSELFNEEKKRQKSLIARVEKIEVQYEGQPEDAKLVMNKHLSTPYDVAKHLSEMLMHRSALALVNGQLWDMHRPLTEDCTVQFLHFHMEDPVLLNKAFWRSCSFMLGSVLEKVFKNDYFVELHSFPAPNVLSGSFVHDADLKIPDWNPSKEELMVLSAGMHRLAEKSLRFERLEVSTEKALEMFKDNKYKKKQIPDIAAASETGTVTLYKLGYHVDISRGPMIGDSSFLGRRCTIAAAHPIVHDGEAMYRFQGVALPKNMFLNHFAFGILEKRAAKLNPINLHQKD